MTIEEARNLIGECEDEISKILTRLYDETGVAPQGVEVKAKPMWKHDAGGLVPWAKAKIIGMEL